MSGLQGAEFALPEVESKHEDGSIIGASSRDPFADRSVCDGTATERGGPQAFHEGHRDGLPIHSYRERHLTATRLQGDSEVALRRETVCCLG
jgi:hypothetical protein